MNPSRKHKITRNYFPSWDQKKSRTKIPIPVKPINCHHPLFPVSCNLLVPTASAGSNVAREKMVPRMGRNWLKAIFTTNRNRKNHQNSGLFAVPLKSTYFWKQTLIASWNCIHSPSYWLAFYHTLIVWIPKMLWVILKNCIFEVFERSEFLQKKITKNTTVTI